ncbi:MAG: tyrosine-type recombinase/integrase [Firmicutes bacterium]|nr:tyrosine-type recombinase/integrase [Bacillota bacterium]
MEGYLSLYIDSLIKEKKKSDNTVEAYRRDVREFIRVLKERGADNPADITEEHISQYVSYLWKNGRSRSTMSRKLSAVRSFMAFLYGEGAISDNITVNVRAPRIEKKEIEFLSIGEIEQLLALPDDSGKGMRDRALLELMYGTGARVSEVIDLKIDRVNLSIGYVNITGEHGKARIIPLGRPCRKALEQYIEQARPVFLQRKGNRKTASGSDYLFVNFRGGKLTRQGIWKIISSYTQEAGITQNVTPQVLRNSFAVHMLQNGADLKSLQELMGFEDASALQGYLSATRNRIKEVYDRTHPRA